MAKNTQSPVYVPVKYSADELQRAAKAGQELPSVSVRHLFLDAIQEDVNARLKVILDEVNERLLAKADSIDAINGAGFTARLVEQHMLKMSVASTKAQNTAALLAAKDRGEIASGILDQDQVKTASAKVSKDVIDMDI